MHQTTARTALAIETNTSALYSELETLLASAPGWRVDARNAAHLERTLAAVRATIAAELAKTQN